MWTHGRMSRRWLSCLLLALLLWLAAGSTSQAETQYTIYESELTQLENNLNQLKQNSEKKEKLLNQQAQELQKANALLEKSLTLNKETETSLQKAKESLSGYEREAEHKMKVKTRQRNLWIAISAGLLYAYVKK